MNSPLKAAVVVATHNRRDRLARLVAALERQTLPLRSFEVVLVDDGSSDGTPELLASLEETSPLTLLSIRQEPPQGPGAARDRGWRATRAPVVAFTDDDCEPEPGWLEALLKLSGNYEDAVVQGRTIANPAESHLLDAFAKTVVVDRPTVHFETCNIAYKRSTLERIDGFRESFRGPTRFRPQSGEDADLGWRALESGSMSLFAPDAVVHHAVFPRSPVEALKGALAATEDLQAYKLNAGLRRQLSQGLFYSHAHALLLQAAYAAWLARRHPAAAAFCLPYLLNLRARSRRSRGGPGFGAFLVAYDAVQMAATLRGAVRYRLPVI